MEQRISKKIDLAAQKFHALFDQLDKEGRFDEVKEILSDLSKEDSDYTPEIGFELCLTSERKENTIDILKTGISFSEESDGFRTEGSSSFSRYLLNGEIHDLPHEYCPNCWESWLYKFESLECPSCEIELGKDLKLLLDSDECPHCGEGKVTRDNPNCTSCNFFADPKYVSWG